MIDIILASASKRREKLLSSIGIKFKVIPSDINEEDIKLEVKNPIDLVKKLSFKKALSIKNKIKSKNFLIISADTIIVLKLQHKNLILGKPKTRHEAEEMLKILKAKKHQVITGVILMTNSFKTRFVYDKSSVYIREFSNKELNAYLDKKLYLDRAGAYGIQDKGFDFLTKYEGSLSNIIGLPLEKLEIELKKFGF